MIYSGTGLLVYHIIVKEKGPCPTNIWGAAPLTFQRYKQGTNWLLQPNLSVSSWLQFSSTKQLTIIIIIKQTTNQTTNNATASNNPFIIQSRNQTTNQSMTIPHPRHRESRPASISGASPLSSSTPRIPIAMPVQWREADWKCEKVAESGWKSSTCLCFMFNMIREAAWKLKVAMVRLHDALFSSSRAALLQGRLFFKQLKQIRIRLISLLDTKLGDAISGGTDLWYQFDTISLLLNGKKMLENG